MQAAKRIDEGPATADVNVTSTVPARVVVTWIAHATVRAGDAERCRTVPLDGCLTHAFRSDAHIQAATSPLGVRLSSQHVSSVLIEIGSLWLDVDAPGHQIPSDAWRADFSEGVTRLRAAERGWMTYDTLHGARLVRRLPEPFAIGTREDAERWRAFYLAEVDRLRSTYGIDADPSCADWQRLFRLPGATRPAGTEASSSSSPSTVPQRLPKGADTQRVSEPWHPDPDDAEAARDPLYGSELGTLFDRLLESGAIRDELPRDGARRFWIRCPFEAGHSTPSAEGDCVLFCKGHDSPGWIQCAHRSCIERSQRDFRRKVSRQASGASSTAELRAAQRGGGERNAVASLPDDPSDDQLLALRLGGRDEFSGLGLDELRKLHGIDELCGHPYELPALRWVGRGLSAGLAIRWAAAMRRRWAA